MSLFQYEIFNMVVEQKSFVKASEMLNITPSAISHSVSKLEEIVGFPLFTRNRNGVQLTRYGEELLPCVRAILKGEDKLTQLIDQLNGLERGAVKVGAFNSVCVNWIPDIIRSFSALYPNISITIYQGGYADVEKWIMNGIVDIGFISQSSSSNLPMKPLYRDALLCVVPKGFKRKNEKYITIDDIKDQTFVYQREGYDTETNAFFEKYALNVFAQFHIQDDHSLVAMVESGFGVSLIPELVMRRLNSDVEAYPLMPEEARIIGIATLDDKYLSPAADRLYKFILSYLEECGIKNV